MKQIAPGPKELVVFESLAAGERAAHLKTLVSSAVRNDLNGWAFVKDVPDQRLFGSIDDESRWRMSECSRIPNRFARTAF